MMKALTCLWAVICLLLMTGCADRVISDGGSGSQTTNTIAGTVKNSEGPAAGVIVTLYTEHFNPVQDQVPDSMRDITNSKGKYLFKAAAAGIYNIQAFQPEDRATSMIQGFEVPDRDDETHFTAPVSKLKKPGTLTIHLDELAVEKDGHVYLMGTGINADITLNDINNGTVTVEEIPPATYPSVHYNAPDMSSETILFEEGVKVRTGETTVIGPFNAWRHTAKIIINTSPTGVDISEAVYNFPLLVRLDDSSLPSPIVTLSLSKGDGDDIRFTKSDGVTILPYEIELWDAANQKAAVWVKVDTIFGGNASQHILIYTGNSGASASSAGPAVFDTTHGFGGVYHFNEDPGGDSPLAIKDRTYYQLHATSTGSMGMSNVVEAIVGKGLLFNGEDEGVFPSSPDLRFYHEAYKEFTMSAWVVLGQMDSGNSVIYEISGVQNGLALAYNADSNRFVFSTLDEWILKRVYSSPVEGAMAEEPVHVAGSYEHGVMKLYMNGMLEATAINGTVIPFHSDLPGIGNVNGCTFITLVSSDCEDGTLPWKGVLDEVRTSKVSRSGSWIKLSYATQKEGSTVVSIQD